MSTITFLTPAQLAALDSNTIAEIESAALRQGYAHDPDAMPADPSGDYDLTTVAGKLAFISEHGADAYAAALAALRGDDQSELTDGGYAAWKSKRGSVKPDPKPAEKPDKGFNFM